MNKHLQGILLGKFEDAMRETVDALEGLCAHYGLNITATQLGDFACIAAGTHDGNYADQLRKVLDFKHFVERGFVKVDNGTLLFDHATKNKFKPGEELEHNSAIFLMFQEDDLSN